MFSIYAIFASIVIYDININKFSLLAYKNKLTSISRQRITNLTVHISNTLISIDTGRCRNIIAIIMAISLLKFNFK